MKNATWYNCQKPTGYWLPGEYLIERAPGARTVIWLNRAAAITGIRSLRAAHKILTDEFASVEKINR